MKKAKDIIFDAKVREKLLRGISITAQAVASTLGPRGRNVAINNPFSTPEVYHDGVTVARQINLKDPFEDMGAELLKSAAIKTNERAGDGTTTATILAEAIITQAFKMIGEGVNPMVLKGQIESEMKIVLEELKKLTKNIETNEEIEQIATISSTDPVIGRMVSQAIKTVGKHGTITVDNGREVNTKVIYKEGFEFDRGYISPYFVTDKDTVEAVVDDPYILITDRSIRYGYEIVPFLDRFIKETKSKNLVIIAGEVSDEALATLVVNKLKGLINVVAVTAPAYGGRRIDEIEDIAVFTGGQVIIADSGTDIQGVQIEQLGRAEAVKVDRDKTIIFGGKGNKEAISSYTNNLKEQIKISNTDFDRDIKSNRLATLSGKVAIIEVGAHSEVEMKEKKERILDAVHATQAAIDEGIVAGGEITLLRLATKVKGILNQAFKAPFKRLMENAGYDYTDKMIELSGKDYPYGIDMLDGKVKDMIASGIIDPARVTRSAIENAVSIAGMIVSTNVMITDIEEEKI